MLNGLLEQQEIWVVQTQTQLYRCKQEILFSLHTPMVIMSKIALEVPRDD